jgi:hypothetical protein
MIKIETEGDLQNAIGNACLDDGLDDPEIRELKVIVRHKDRNWQISSVVLVGDALFLVID